MILKERCIGPLSIERIGEFSRRLARSGRCGLHQTIYVIGYNTKLVPAGAAPSYDDLLLPRWKGQLGWDTEEYYLFGALMKALANKGLDFGAASLLRSIFAKATRSSPSWYRRENFRWRLAHQHRVDEYIEKGAPLQWVALSAGGRIGRDCPAKKCAAPQRS
jgi:hypothetical protein